MKWNEMWPREETKRGGEPDPFEAMRYGLLADAARTVWVMVAWAFELLGGWAARVIGGTTQPVSSGEPAGPAADRAEPAAGGAAVPGTEPGAPMTLRELGLPPDLASEFEAVFRLMGRAEGDLVAGYVFLAPDGVRHPVRLAPANGPGSPPEPGQDLAA